MNIGKLGFSSIKARPDLLAHSTLAMLNSLSQASDENVGVAEVDPLNAYGEKLCAYYDIDPSVGGNCVIIEASRGDRRWYAACLVPMGCRIDLNGFVRKHLNARKVSLASRDNAVSLSAMEYGSINVVGLPDQWPILIDSKLAAKPFVIMGSGLVRSKLAISGSLLSKLPNSEVIDGLGISVSQ